MIGLLISFLPHKYLYTFFIITSVMELYSIKQQYVGRNNEFEHLANWKVIAIAT